MSAPWALMSVVVLLGGLCSCSVDTSVHTVDLPPDNPTPEIIGDGLEVRCYGVHVSDEALHRAIVGLSGQLRSSHELVLQGMEYYVIPADRVDDFISIVSDGAAWNVRWHGQQFAWNNMLPHHVPYENESDTGWLTLPARSWSTMMEDGPVVYLEALPCYAGEGDAGMVNRPMDHLRTEVLLRPGVALVLLGGTGRPLEDEIIESQDDVEPVALGSTFGQHLLKMGRGDDGGPDSADSHRNRGNVMIFLPRFTGQRRLPPLRAPM